MADYCEALQLHKAQKRMALLDDLLAAKGPIYDPAYGGYRVFLGDVSPRATKYDMEREFEYYGTVLDVWLARNIPVCFSVFKHSRDADRCVRDLDGRTVGGRRVRVEHARPYAPRGGRGAPPTPPRQRFKTSRSRSRERRRRRRSYSRSFSRSRSRSPVRRERREPTPPPVGHVAPSEVYSQVYKYRSRSGSRRASVGSRGSPGGAGAASGGGGARANLSDRGGSPLGAGFSPSRDYRDDD